MSFPNTHTPKLSEITGEAKYQCPTHIVNGAVTYYMTPELEARFRKLYPVTMNRDMMQLFGISFSTVQRFKRQFGLEKKMKTIRRKQAAVAKKINEESGFFDTLRGKPLSEACYKAAAEKRATGWHPLKGLSHRNNRKYHRIMKKRSENRKELMRKEKMRVEWGGGCSSRLIFTSPMIRTDESGAYSRTHAGEQAIFRAIRISRRSDGLSSTLRKRNEELSERKTARNLGLSLNRFRCPIFY